MKLPSVLILAGLMFARAAFAQTEQWLAYHTGGDARSYQQLEVSSRPPAGVALPKLNSSPYFARWLTPMDPGGGRWLCLDRSRKSGPYDRLFIDSTGNGRLDDKTPILARQDSSESGFPPARINFKGEDGPITYHLLFRFYQFANNAPQLLMSSAGWYEGVVNFDGVKKRLQLIDGNVNGAFNDVATDPYGGDRVQIDGDKTADRLLGRMLQVDGKYFRVEVARDGAFVKVQKADSLTLGHVHMPKVISEFAAFGENGHFTGKPVDGQFTLPVGTYHVFEWTINRKDEKGAAWTLTGRSFPKDAWFEVTAGNQPVLEIGEPVQAVLKAGEGVNRQVEFSLRFEGRQKESIEMLRGGQRPAGPKLVLVNAAGTTCYTNTFEFG